MARRFNPALLKMLERKRERKRLADRGAWSRQRKRKKDDLPKIRTGVEDDAIGIEAGPVPFHVKDEAPDPPRHRPLSRPESLSPRKAGLYLTLRLEMVTRAAKQTQKKRLRVLPDGVKRASERLRSANGTKGAASQAIEPVTDLEDVWMGIIGGRHHAADGTAGK